MVSQCPEPLKSQELRSRATGGDESGSDWDTVERHGGLNVVVEKIDQLEQETPASNGTGMIDNFRHRRDPQRPWDRVSSRRASQWVRHFQLIPELVPALEDVRALYNQHWLIERLGFEPLVQARQHLALHLAA